LHPCEKYVSVGKHPYVVELIAFAGGISPDDFSVVDKKHLPVIFADVEHRMLRETIAG